MDWRSFTQVKEMGVTVTDCPLIAQDLSKVFQVYWALGMEDANVPVEWPNYLSTNFNISSPAKVSMGDSVSQVYISSSPPAFNPRGRTDDIDAILATINSARKIHFTSL